ncbi:hypothetical protein KY366_00665, partial [Candidatus Woesearchaeota archaeon]|nr:hypothetical protein [Candidatus Woesearchaeota archaeon]
MIDNAHWNDVKGITNMFLFHYGFPAATSRSLFRYGFPAVKHVITKETWPIIVRGLVEIGGYSGENAYYLFRYSLPAIKGAITKETWPIIVRGLVKMIGSAGYHARDLFRYGLSAIKDIITTETWPGLVKMTESSGKNAYYLFHYGLPAVKDMDIITEETWPGLVKMAESSGEDTIVLFRDGLPAIKDIITEETWPGLVKMAESSGKKTYYLFHYGLLAVKDIITTETWPGLVKMVESYGENSPDLFRDGLSAVKDLIRTQTSYLILDYLNELIGYCKGVEIRTLKALSPLQPLFNGFGRQLFDLLLIPTAKSQTVAAFLCFESYGEIPINALKSKSDLELLRWIVEKKSRKANDILRHIIIEGLDRRIIRIPLSKESKIIKEFLNNTPVYLIELYTEFKNIYNGNLTNKKIHYERLFKEVRKLKKEIIKGTLSKEYNQNILLAVIFSVFSPEVSIDRDLYSRAIESRE